jgi:membrane protease YdiL (CAAX protease family)
MDSLEKNNVTDNIVVENMIVSKPKAGDWFELISYPILGFVFSLLAALIIGLAILLPFMIMNSNSLGTLSSSNDILAKLSGNPSMQAMIIFLLAVSEIGMIIPIFLFGFSFKKFSWESFGLKPLKFKWKWILESLAIVIVVNGLEILLEYLQTRYGFRLPEANKGALELLNPTSRSVWLYLVFLLSIGIIGPICEELLFRGAIYGWFRRYYKPWIGILVSSLFFGVLHYETMLRMIFAISIGAYMAWMYEREKNLAAPITLHILNNSAVLTLMFLVPNL